MAHNLFGERFLDNRTPAWHGKGEVFTDPLNAEEAYARVGKDLKQFTAPLHVHGHTAQAQLPGFQGLFSYLPGAHDGGVALNGGTLWTHACVTDQYEPLFHRDAVARFNRATGATIETMGLLGHGETLFLSVLFPSISIVGEEHKPYLLLFNPIDGVTAITAKDCLTRVVCQNTCMMALAESARWEFRGIHYKGIGDRLETWLRDVWGQQNQAIATLKDACELLAAVPTEPLASSYQTVIKTTYPLPVMPEKVELRESWEKLALSQATHHSLIRQLFEDSPTRTAATTGNLWGLYQAVCEYEDFGRKRVQAASRFMGAGAERKEKAFQACLSTVPGVNMA